MLLKKISLKNFCQFREGEYTFGTGINGIVAPIGAGKSSLIAAIKGSLTNEFAPGEQKIQDVNWHAPEQEAAWVQATWEHQGQLVELFRGLRPSRSRLAFPGSSRETITRQREIAEELRSLLNTSSAALSAFAFVPQWECSNLLKADNETRIQSFMALCGIEGFESLRAHLASQITSDRPLAVEILDDRAENRERLAEARQQAKQLESQMEALSQGLLTKEEQLAQQKRMQRLEAILQARRKLPRLEEELETLQKEHSRSSSLAQQVRQHREQLTEQVRQYSERWQTIQTQEKRVKRYQLYVARRDQLMQDLATEPPPEVPPLEGYYPGVVEELTQQVLRLEDAHKSVQERIMRFTELGTCDCPTCGTAGQTIQEDLMPAWKRDLQEQEAELETLTTQLAAFREHAEQLERYQRRRQRWKQILEVAQDKLDHLEEVEPAEPIPASQVTQALEQLEAARHDLEQVTTKVESLVTTTARLEGRIESLQTQIQELAQLAEKPASQKDIRKIQQRLDRHGEAATQHAKLQESYRNLTQVQIPQYQQAIRKVREHLQRTEVVKQWLEGLEIAREEIHRRNLPSRIVLEDLQQVVDRANRTMESFGSPFVVRCESDLSLSMSKGGSDFRPITRLSGGELLLFATAFRFAAMRQMISSVDFICLDEPFHGLSDDKVEELVGVLEELGRYLRSDHKQMIIITHDERLKRAFDWEISL